MEDLRVGSHDAITILDVLSVDLCARAILEHVSVWDLVRSERVCKRWQRAVHHYLQCCRNLGFLGCHTCMIRPNRNNHVPVLKIDHRTIIFKDDQYSGPLLRSLLDKWGHLLKKATVGHDLEIFGLKCPNLQEIEIHVNELTGYDPLRIKMLKRFKQLKHIVLISYYPSSDSELYDLHLTKLIRNMNLDNIEIINSNVTGSFLKYVKPNLKSLTLLDTSFQIHDVLSAVHNLRNLTTLKLEHYYCLPVIHLLLKEMPLIEELSLCDHGDQRNSLSEESIAVFGGLANLKLLSVDTLHGAVNDAFLEALAQGCKKLEYLRIRDPTAMTVRGVAALCRRAPLAVTTLHYGGMKHKHALESAYLLFAKSPLYQQLAALGCVELTREWFKAMSQDPRGRELLLNPKPDGTAPVNDPPQKLKLVLF